MIPGELLVKPGELELNAGRVDTALAIEIERDYAIYGEEVKFGGGKVIRDGMGHRQSRHRPEGWPDRGDW